MWHSVISDQSYPRHVPFGSQEGIIEGWPYLSSQVVCNLSSVSSRGQKGAECEVNLIQCSLITLSRVYEGEFGVIPELKLLCISVQLPSLVPGTPIFAGQEKRQHCDCLRSHATYYLSGLELAVTLIRNSKQSIA